MIGEFPGTWLVNEVMACVVFIMCMFHALKQKDYKTQLFQLIMFVFGAAVFEHVGVLFTKTYSYDQHRIMMFGAIPLATLLLEAAIVYSSMVLFRYLNMKPWMSIWVVGFLCVFQDFSIDPVYIHDTYIFGNGAPSGQWNWVFKYDNSFFGIPYQNFTGWIYMTGFYAALIYLFHWMAKRWNKQWLHTATPFLAGILLIVPIMVFGMILIDGGSKLWPEAIKLILGCLIGVVLMALYFKKMSPINVHEDGIIFTVPLILQVYNLAIGFGKGLTDSFIPLIVCTIIEVCYFGYLYAHRAKDDMQANPLGSISPR